MVILKWAHPSSDFAQVKFYHVLKLGTLNRKRLISYRILGILGAQIKIKIYRSLEQFFKTWWKILFLYIFDCLKHCWEQNLEIFKFGPYFAHLVTKILTFWGFWAKKGGKWGKIAWNLTFSKIRSLQSLLLPQDCH